MPAPKGGIGIPESDVVKMCVALEALGVYLGVDPTVIQVVLAKARKDLLGE